MNERIRKKKNHPIAKVVIGILVIILIIIPLGFVSPLITVRYTMTDPDLPADFDGFKIVQLTDFHCRDFGINEADLIKRINDCQPDIICLTGDIVDEDHSVTNAEYLLAGIYETAPIYYVTGNHEFYAGAPYNEFRGICDKYGVHVLESTTEDITIGDSTIKISGLDFYNDYKDMFKHLSYADTDYYNILLYHDSTKFDFIGAFDYNLVLCGHIHGGIIRLPFIGGLLGSDYLPFPKYDYGVFNLKNSTMLSSSGLGDARVPRWNNPREVVEVTLRCE